MDACPFCHAPVSEHLARFGGKCPACFGLVPGEETATDPGEHIRAALDREHEPRRPSRILLPAVAVFAALGLVAAAAWSLVRPEPVATVLDFDQAGYAVGDMQFVAWVEPAPAPVPARVAHPRPAPAPSSSDAVAGVAEVAPEAVPGAPQTGGIQFGLDVGVSRRATQGVRLTDDGQIVEMIKGVLTSESPKLKSCYEQRLKVREDLAGRWMLSLVVTRDGKARDIAVTGMDTTDAEMESCIASKVAGWAFQPIRVDQPIQKSLGFTSGF